MKPFFPLTTVLVTLFLFSCHGRDAAGGEAATGAAARDSSGSRPMQFVEMARLDLPGNAVALAGKFLVDTSGPSGDESPLYCVYIDKKSGKNDTAVSDDGSVGTKCPACQFFIKDMTDSFGLNAFVVQIVTPDDDDNYANNFFGLVNGRFQKLFSMMDTREDGLPLHREGLVLTGLRGGRDEIFNNPEQNFPVRVDTKTFQVIDSLPDVQYIGYDGHALQPIRAHRVIDGRSDTSLVAIPAGAKIHVDTLYRALGKVAVTGRH